MLNSVFPFQNFFSIDSADNFSISIEFYESCRKSHPIKLSQRASGLADATHIEEIARGDEDDDDVVDHDGDVYKILQNDNDTMMMILVTVMMTRASEGSQTRETFRKLHELKGRGATRV